MRFRDERNRKRRCQEVLQRLSGEGLPSVTTNGEVNEIILDAVSTGDDYWSISPDGVSFCTWRDGNRKQRRRGKSKKKGAPTHAGKDW